MDHPVTEDEALVLQGWNMARGHYQLKGSVPPYPPGFEKAMKERAAGVVEDTAQQTSPSANPSPEPSPQVNAPIGDVEGNTAMGDHE